MIRAHNAAIYARMKRNARAASPRGVETGRLVAALLRYGVDLSRGRESVRRPPPQRGAPHKSVFHGFLHAYLVADEFLRLETRGGNRRGRWKDLALDNISGEKVVRERGRGSSRSIFEKSYDLFRRAALRYAQDVQTFDQLVISRKPIPADLLRRLAEFDAITTAAYRPPRFIWGPKKSK